MSWFSDNIVDPIKQNPVTAIGTVLGGAAVGTGGAIAGGLGGSLFDKKQEQAPPPPGMDPAVAGLRDQRIKEASDFRSNLPGYEKDASQNLANQSRRQLAGDIATNNMSSNRRGLLGSGLNQAANAQASGRAATGYASANQGMVNQLQDQADQMEQSAINNGYQYWQSSKAIQDSAYNAALSNMLAARSGTTALIGAGAKVGGAALGAA